MSSRSSLFISSLLIAAAAWSCSSPPIAPLLPDASPDSSSGVPSGDDQTGDASSTPEAGSGAADATVEGGAAIADASPDAASEADAAVDASMTSDAAADAAAEASVPSDAGDAGAASDAGDAAPVPSGPWVYVFDGGETGAVGGRAGADALCTAAAATLDAGAPFAHVRAFLGVSASDEIRDMPANYGVPTDRPIGSVSGTVIANAWSALLGGTILHSLSAAGVFEPNFGQWYSGSNADGSLATQTSADAGVHDFTCSGWTSSDGFLDGEYGLGGATDSTWMAVGQATCGLGSYDILCVGWN